MNSLFLIASIFIASATTYPTDVQENVITSGLRLSLYPFCHTIFGNYSMIFYMIIFNSKVIFSKDPSIFGYLKELECVVRHLKEDIIEKFWPDVLKPFLVKIVNDLIAKYPQYEDLITGVVLIIEHTYIFSVSILDAILLEARNIIKCILEHLFKILG